MDTEPNKPLEAKCYTREEDVWLSWACQIVREGIEKIAVVAIATETGTTGGRRRLSTGNICPTLGPIPNSCPVLKSCTIHLE